MIDIIIRTIIFIGYVISGVTSVYYVTISIAGWFRKKTPNPNDFPISNRFAVVIAAYNEKLVIGYTIDSINNIDYPDELVDIYVVADNCTDDTAEIARKKGAIVFERFDNIKKGKGHALTWLFDKIWDTNIKYDAVCLLDADNLVDKCYFKEMNKSLHLGYGVIQGYLGCKNPEDSWISGCYSITYWLNNRLFQLSRFQIGLSCGIGGTGFVVRADLLKEIGWDSHCLTEDLEFQLKIVSRGLKVAWNHDAIFYDEKPITLAQSFKQRTRWMQGHTDCVTRFFWKLVKKGFKDRDFVALDTAFYLIQAYLLSIVWIITIVSMIYYLCMIFVDFNNFYTLIQIVFGMELLMLVYGLFLFVEKKLTWKILLYLMIFPFYLYTWLIPIYLGWIRRKESAWVHTEHIRSLEVRDML